MTVVTSPDAPRPAGHYAQAVVHGDLVFASGQLPIDPASGQPVRGTVEEQTRLVFRNLAAVLTAAGSSLAQALRVTVYVSDVALWPRVNATYAEVFGDHRPARTVVPTGPLHYGLDVEADAVAVRS